MKNIKNYLFLGVFLIIANVGFAQTALLHIYPSSLNSMVIFNYYELEYRNVADDYWVSVGRIEASELFSPYTLTGLELGATYQVRVIPYLLDEDGNRWDGAWGEIVEFTMPTFEEILDFGVFEDVGPIYVEAGRFSLRPNYLSASIPDPDVILFKNKQEAIKED